TISAGVTTLEADSSDADLLREQADSALYDAKRRGRNAVVSFAEVRDRAPIVPAVKIHALRRLLATPDISAAFQPIWDLDQTRVIAFEALARPSSEYGLDGP